MGLSKSCMSMTMIFHRVDFLLPQDKDGYAVLNRKDQALDWMEWTEFFFGGL